MKGVTADAEREHQEAGDDHAAGAVAVGDARRRSAAPRPT